jgi:hypothetical protein
MIHIRTPAKGPETLHHFIYPSMAPDDGSEKPKEAASQKRKRERKRKRKRKRKRRERSEAFQSGCSRQKRRETYKQDRETEDWCGKISLKLTQRLQE